MYRARPNIIEPNPFWLFKYLRVLTFCEASESIASNGCLMYEDIISTIVGCNEAKSFLAIPPLAGSELLGHDFD